MRLPCRSVDLDRHGVEGGAHVTRLQQFHGQPGGLHSGEKPLRQRPRLQAPYRLLKMGKFRSGQFLAQLDVDHSALARDRAWTALVTDDLRLAPSCKG